jgi:hypothetical protein
MWLSDRNDKEYMPNKSRRTQRSSIITAPSPLRNNYILLRIWPNVR